MSSTEHPSSSSLPAAASTSAEDYRTWHLAKGADYDQYLEESNLDRYLAQCERRLIGTIVPSLFPAGIPRYLDFACGTGRITSLIEPLAQTSYGVDISETMVAEARRRCTKTVFVLADLTRESRAIGQFDLITGFRFLGNAQHDLRQDALAALRGLCADGGYLLMNNHRNPWSLHSTILRLVGRNRDHADLHYLKLRKLFSTAGFRVVRTYAVGFWLARARFSEPKMTESGMAVMLERLSRLPGTGPFSPDYLILAQKVS